MAILNMCWEIRRVQPLCFLGMTGSLHPQTLWWDVNSLRPSDAIWRQWSWTTLAQVMACCLTAPSHYLNQCWLIIRGVLWHTSESSFAGIAQGIDSGYEFEKDILKNIFKSPRGQWVKHFRDIERHRGRLSVKMSSYQYRNTHVKDF